MATQAATVTTAAPTTRAPAHRRGGFKYLLVAPAVFILLAFGLFPFLYAVVVSFQKLSLLDQYTDFQGLLNYAPPVPGPAPLERGAAHRRRSPRWRCRCSSCSGCCSRTTSSTTGPSSASSSRC